MSFDAANEGGDIARAKITKAPDIREDARDMNLLLLPSYQDANSRRVAT
jgi:hypothetical protein